MKRIAITLALFAAPLASCVHPSAQFTTALERAESGYASAKAYAEMLVPFLPAAHVAQIRAIEARIEAALAIARSAVTAAQRAEALRTAEAATVELVRD